MPIKPENKARYPKEWRQISFAIRFIRAEGRCEFIEPSTGERCEAEHGRPHPISGSLVVLTTAHLDHQPENCDDENLRAGCQRCHLRYDAEHHAANRRASATKERERIMAKAGQIAFDLECATGRRIAR